MGRVVLVTGVSRDLGRRFARITANDPAVDRVIGVDVVPPRGDIGEMTFIRADIRNPVIAKIIVKEDVDTVVHMSVIATPGSAGGRTSMKEFNVIGTMQLLAACQKAPGLRHLVIKSTTTVYGASSRDPAMFTEDMNPKRRPASGYAKDAFEVEWLRPRLRAPAPRRTRHDAAHRQRHRTPDAEPDRCSTSTCRSSRPCSASTRACSSCTRPTCSRCSGTPPRRRLRHLQRGRRRRHHAVPGDPPDRPPVAPAAGLRGLRLRVGDPPGRVSPTSRPSRSRS